MALRTYVAPTVERLGTVAFLTEGSGYGSSDNPNPCEQAAYSGSGSSDGGDKHHKKKKNWWDW